MMTAEISAVPNEGHMAALEIATGLALTGREPGIGAQLERIAAIEAEIGAGATIGMLARRWLEEKLTARKAVGR